MEKFTPEPEKKVSTWEKVRKWGEVAGLVTLMSIGGAESGLAKSRAEAPHAGATASEKMPASAAQKEKALEKIAKESGTDAIINGMPAKKIISKDGINTIIFGQSADGKVWISLSSHGGKIVYLDINCDGQVERVVVDMGTTKGKHASMMLDAFSDLDSLAMKADMMPSDEAILAFMKEGGKHIVRTINMKTGDKTVLEGADATKASASIASDFSAALDSF